MTRTTLGRASIAHIHIRTLLLLAASLLVIVLGGCATTPTHPVDLPPILSQDELFRPYLKLGTVRVSRERLGSIEDFRKEGDDWAFDALRLEAQKLGADAVILAEIRTEKDRFLFFPTTEVTAQGLAIKFR